MTKYYLVIEPDEDGNPASILDEEELEEWMEDRDLDDCLSFQEYRENSDPNYWGEGRFFIARLVNVGVTPKKMVKTFTIEDDNE